MKKKNVWISIAMAVMLLVLPLGALAAEENAGEETLEVSLETIKMAVSLPATWITFGGGEEMTAMGILYMGSNAEGDVMLQISHKQDEETLEIVKENFANFEGISNLEDIEVNGMPGLRYELINSICYLVQLEDGSLLGVNFTTFSGEIDDGMKATMDNILHTLRAEDAAA